MRFPKLKPDSFVCNLLVRVQFLILCHPFSFSLIDIPSLTVVGLLLRLNGSSRLKSTIHDLCQLWRYLTASLRIRSTIQLHCQHVSSFSLHGWRLLSALTEHSRYSLCYSFLNLIASFLLQSCLDFLQFFFPHHHLNGVAGITILLLGHICDIGRRVYI